MFSLIILLYAKYDHRWGNDLDDVIADEPYVSLIEIILGSILLSDLIKWYIAKVRSKYW